MGLASRMNSVRITLANEKEGLVSIGVDALITAWCAGSQRCPLAVFVRVLAGEPISSIQGSLPDHLDAAQGFVQQADVDSSPRGPAIARRRTSHRQTDECGSRLGREVPAGSGAATATSPHWRTARRNTAGLRTPPHRSGTRRPCGGIARARHALGPDRRTNWRLRRACPPDRQGASDCRAPLCCVAGG